MGIVGLTLMFTVNAQTTGQQYVKQRNGVLLYNVLFNGLIGGVGGLIHKKEGEKPLKVFGKNFLLGSTGGFIKYKSKLETYNLYVNSNNQTYSYVNRLTFFLGNSIVNNASLNEPAFSKLNFQLYLFNFDVDTRNHWKTQTRLSVMSTGYFIGSIALGDRLDLTKSLEHGIFYYRINPGRNFQDNGYAGYNMIALNYSSGSVVAHEIVHIYQLYDYLPLNNLYEKKTNAVLGENKLYNKLKKYFYLEVPYLHPYYLGNTVLNKNGSYYDNFFEFEAQHFATRWYVQR